MWIPLYFGMPDPTDAMLSTIGASVPVFFLALAVGAAPALSPTRLIRGRFSLASAIPAFVLMILVEYQTLAWLGVKASSRPSNLSLWLLIGMVLIMIGTTWTILAAGWHQQKHAPVQPESAPHDGLSRSSTSAKGVVNPKRSLTAATTSSGRQNRRTG